MALYAGMKITVMGLGLHGGGFESARYLALNGAECTITDMKDEKTLAPSIEKLEAITGKHPPFRFVLGRHEMDDFVNADMVVKNPGVRPDSPFLKSARKIETDISLFLTALRSGKAATSARLIAVTGSKGKSGTARAIHWVLTKAREKSHTNTQNYGNLNETLRGKVFLGGNITVSPLSFLDELTAEDDVVLELSSWQLGDLKGRNLLKPRSAVLTSILPDHLDWYNGSMENYVNDKRVIYQSQNKDDATIACADDHWGMSFLSESPGRPLSYSAKTAPSDIPETMAWIDPRSGAGMIQCGGETSEAAPASLLVPGFHNKKNLLAAALSLTDLGLPVSLVRENLGSYPGLEHRLEFFRETEGIFFYNDTAATIPEAAAAAIEAFAGSVIILVTGGTDKNLDFGPLARAAQSAREIILLSGTGSDKLIPILKSAGISFHGPFSDINEAACRALELGRKAAASPLIGQNPRVIAVMSPGCASFGMFQNEFDRGRQWKAAVNKL